MSLPGVSGDGTEKGKRIWMSDRMTEIQDCLIMMTR